MAPTIGSSKTIAAPLARVYAAWDDPELRRRWLGDDAGFEVRTATPGKSMRITWVDGESNVSVQFEPERGMKCRVQVEHEKLPDAEAAERMKGFWAERLERLADLLESR